MKLALVALLLALLSACSQTMVVHSPGSDKGFVSTLIDRTVRVTVRCAESSGWGSGVVLGPSPSGQAVVATAAHVVDDIACDWRVRGFKAERLSYDEEHDVALLRVPISSGALLDASRPYLGMPVLVTGYPYQFYTGDAELQVSRGDVLAEFKDRYRVSAPAYFGSSGGPVWDESGQLVGLLVEMSVSGRAPIDGAYYVTPASNVFRPYFDLWLDGRRDDNPLK